MSSAWPPDQQHRRSHARHRGSRDRAGVRDQPRADGFGRGAAGRGSRCAGRPGTRRPAAKTRVIRRPRTGRSGLGRVGPARRMLSRCRSGSPRIPVPGTRVPVMRVLGTRRPDMPNAAMPRRGTRSLDTPVLGTRRRDLPNAGMPGRGTRSSDTPVPGMPSPGTRRPDTARCRGGSRDTTSQDTGGLHGEGRRTAGPGTTRLRTACLSSGPRCAPTPPRTADPRYVPEPGTFRIRISRISCRPGTRRQPARRSSLRSVPAPGETTSGTTINATMASRAGTVGITSRPDRSPGGARTGGTRSPKAASHGRAGVVPKAGAGRDGGAAVGAR